MLFLIIGPVNCALSLSYMYVSLASIRFFFSIIAKVHRLSFLFHTPSFNWVYWCASLLCRDQTHITGEMSGAPHPSSLMCFAIIRELSLCCKYVTHADWRPSLSYNVHTLDWLYWCVDTFWDFHIIGVTWKDAPHQVQGCKYMKIIENDNKNIISVKWCVCESRSCNFIAIFASNFEPFWDQ